MPRILYLIMFLFLTLVSSKRLRNLLDESITINRTGRNEEEMDSISTCESSTYRYLNFYVTGQNVTFKKFINKDNALPLIYDVKGIGEGNISEYIERLAIYSIFLACALISIIVWVCNWVCWKNQCCCCDFLHNTTNKLIVWWSAVTFLLGIMACCISGFVIMHRFSDDLNGVECAVERFYYDTLYGQLKIDKPYWEGIAKTNEKITTLKNFIEVAKNNTVVFVDDQNEDWIEYNNRQINMPYEGAIQNLFKYRTGKKFIEKLLSVSEACYKGRFYSTSDLSRFFFSNRTDLPTREPYVAYEWVMDVICNGEGTISTSDSLGRFTFSANKILFELSEKYREMKMAFAQIQSGAEDYVKSLNQMNGDISDIEKDFKTFVYDGNFIERFKHHIKVAYGVGYVLPLIYFIILLGLVLFGIAMLITYSCVRDQYKFLTLLTITWNVIRFFMFSFFVYGAAYGMLFLGIRDGIAFCMYAFGSENLSPKEQTYIVPSGSSKEFMRYCILEENANYINKLDSLLSDVLSNFWTSFTWLKTSLNDGTSRFPDGWRTDMMSHINSVSSKLKKIKVGDIEVEKIINEFYNKVREGDIWVIFNDEQKYIPLEYKAFDFDENKFSEQLKECYVNNTIIIAPSGFSNCNQDYKFYINLNSISSFEQYDVFQNFISHLGAYSTLGIDLPVYKAAILYYVRTRLAYDLIKKDIEDLTSQPIYIANYYNSSINENSKESGSKNTIGELFNNNKYKTLLDKSEGFFDSFKCGYMRNDVNIIYTTMYDLSSETRILCALSCCIGFFGALAVYLILWTLHHYNRDIFREGGMASTSKQKRAQPAHSNISPAKTYMIKPRKNDSPRIDPTYKKRKIRSEIEMTSRNEDESKESYKKSLSQNEVK